MNALAGWPGRHPVAALSALLAIALAATVLAPWLPLERLPAAPGTGVRVQAELPGVDARRIETLVTRPLEQVLTSLPGLRQMISRSTEGRTVIELQFGRPAQREDALELARERLTDAASLLPAGIASPLLERDDPLPRAAAVYAIVSDSLSAELARWAERELRRPLNELRGAASASLSGVDAQELLIQPDARRLAALGLSFDDVIQALRSADQAPPTRPPRRVATTTTAGTEAIAARAVRLPDGESIALAEVTQVSVVQRPVLERRRHNGQPVYLLSVTPRSTADAAALAERTHAHVAWVQANGLVPAKVTLQPLFNESNETRVWFRRVLKRIGAVFVVALAAVYLLLGWRSAATTFAALLVWLPVCATALWIGGLSFNIMTVTGLLFAAVALVGMIARPGAAPAIAAAAALSGLASGLLPAWSAAYAQTIASLSLMSLLAVPVAWLMSARAERRASVPPLARRLPPRWRASMTPILLVVLLLGAAVAGVRSLPAAVAEVSGASISVRVWGGTEEDRPRLAQWAAEVMQILRTAPGVSAVVSTATAEPTWYLQLDDQRLPQVGIDLAQIGRAFDIARDGLVVGELTNADAQLPLRVQLPPDAAGVAFERLLLRGERRDQRALYLRDVGTAERVVTARELVRVQQRPAVEIRGRGTERFAPSRLASARAKLDLPAGYTAEWKWTPLLTGAPASTR